MTTARDLLRPARDASAPELPIEAALAGSDAWQAVFDDINVAVRASFDEIVDEDVAAALVDPADSTDHRGRHAFAQLSERCVEAVTVDGLFLGPTSDIVPLWRALAADIDAPAVGEALDGADPADDIDDVESAVTLVANDDRELGEARFESPVDAVWEPVERVIVACVDGNLAQRLGRDAGD